MTPAIISPNVSLPEAPKRPRRSWTVAEQTAYVADFAASGLSATAFCRRLGIRRATLARWRQRAAGVPAAAAAPVRTPVRRAASAGFAAVTVVPDAQGRTPTPSVPSAASPAQALALVLRAPSGVVADVAGLDLAAAAALLRAVLTPGGAGAA